MKVLVLGGNGFIGSHLVDILLSEGHRVRVFDKCEEHYRKPLTEVEYHFGDFGNRCLVNASLEDIDTVFHLISSTLPQTSNDDPAFDVLSNVVETLYLLKQCVARQIRKFVFISSGGTVYGNPEGLPVSENSPTNPLCSYGITKLTIEKHLVLFHLLHGLDYVVLRPSNAYGDRQNPNSIQGAIPVFLGRISRGLDIEIWGDGEVVRDYIFIDDLVDCIYKAALLTPTSRILNVGSGVGYSLNELVRVMREVTGVDARICYRDKRYFDVGTIYLDITKATEELSWSPVVSLTNGIRKTWDFIRKNG